MIEQEDKKVFYSLLNKPAIAVPMVLVLLMVLVAAVVVVVKNAGKVQIGPAPVPVGPLPKDTTLLKSRRHLLRSIERLERRLTEYRQKVATFAPRQDSLFNLCRDRLARLWDEFALVEAAGSYVERKERLANTRKKYVQVREMVSDFGRSVDSTISESLADSLDKEFEKLIRD